MRIAIVIDSLIRAGAERQALNAVLELTRAGRDVELIYYRDNGPQHTHPAFEQARVTPLLKQGKPVRFIWRLGRYLKQGRFDIVHAFKNTPAAYAYVAARLAGIRVVLAGFRAEYDATGFYHLADLLVNRVAAGWVVNSQATARSLFAAIRAKPERVFVVHNGIEPAAFRSTLSSAEAKQRLGLDPQTPTASITAMMRPQKNHRLFLDAAALALKETPAARFLVVGDGDLRASLEDYARSLDISESVRFLGNRSDIPEVLAATDVSVLTSHYEGISNALLEAMSAGVPVVTTDYAGVDELVAHGQVGLIVPRGDARGVASGIVRLLQDPALRRQMGENGRQRVATEFSMSAMATRLYSVYENCLTEYQQEGHSR